MVNSGTSTPRAAFRPASGFHKGDMGGGRIESLSLGDHMATNDLLNSPRKPRAFPTTVDGYGQGLAGYTMGQAASCTLIMHLDPSASRQARQVIGLGGEETCSRSGTPQDSLPTMSTCPCMWSTNQKHTLTVCSLWQNTISIGVFWGLHRTSVLFIITVPIKYM